MKAILSSTGITTPELASTLSKLAGKPLGTVSVAVINEAAAVEPGDKRWFFEEMHSLGQLVGGEIDVINILALDSKTIQRRMDFADVVYVVGGMTDYLMKVFERTGFGELLKDNLLNDKVYVGVSAGAMVFGRRINTNGYKDVYRKGDHNLNIKEYLALVDFSIFPHLNSTLWTRNRVDVIQHAATGASYPIYATEDTQAVVVSGDEITFVGGDVVKIGNA